MTNVMKKAALPFFAISIVFSFAFLCAAEDEMRDGQWQTVDNAAVMQTYVPDSACVSQNDVSAQDILSEQEKQPTAYDILAEVEPMPYDSYLVKMQNITDADLDSVCKQYHATGVQCAVIEDGFVKGSYVYGFAARENGRAVTAQTKYRVASLSKLVTDMVFMKLSENGIVSPDADISDYYGFTVRNPSFPDVMITPRMLMTHTASIVDGNAFNRALETYSSEPVRSLLSDESIYSSDSPGSTYVYSNLSNALVGSVCELASGMCFENLVQNLLLEPMHIDGGFVASSIADADDIGLLYGSSSTLQSQLSAQFSSVTGQTVHIVQGNFTVSASDYAQLLCVLLNDGLYADGTRILSEETVGEMLKVQFETSTYGVSLGSFVYEGIIGERTLFCHTGSAYGMYACFVLDPAGGDGVVVLTSGADYSVDKNTEIYDICLDIIRLVFPA